MPTSARKEKANLKKTGVLDDAQIDLLIQSGIKTGKYEDDLGKAPAVEDIDAEIDALLKDNTATAAREVTPLRQSVKAATAEGTEMGQAIGLALEARFEAFEQSVAANFGKLFQKLGLLGEGVRKVGHGLNTVVDVERAAAAGVEELRQSVKGLKTASKVVQSTAGATQRADADRGRQAAASSDGGRPAAADLSPEERAEAAMEILQQSMGAVNAAISVQLDQVNRAINSGEVNEERVEAAKAQREVLMQSRRDIQNGKHPLDVNTDSKLGLDLSALNELRKELAEAAN